ncbi:uncharacterized protein LAESUDRAFT_765365 [Laetiporus sulphureus 93-53]|uniref:BTB domain-containing protein n=1 Tax=Laetiporus sulphureus 93-53 TaxID=1314785 RepID=A0A165AT15_9APHY|nr:uncharacterized protein LAESUDRAFT_765365 [Laetiporus sulphureus 93-53]KZS99600.1 hypothetical protein LAESUDRAFT_765365 [Laetiporus sulphureus 93-53]
MQPPQLKFDDKFNLPDGKLIVVSQGLGFRIHQDDIARWNPELADAVVRLTADGTAPMEIVEDESVDEDDGMSPVPSGEDREGYTLSSSHLLEECVVLHLDIEADDIRRFLGAVYSMDMTRSTEPKDFATIASVLRLAYYFKIQDLIDGLLKKICTWFPKTLDEWKAFVNDESPSLVLKPDDIVTAIKVAHMTDTMSILPTALYRCCSLDAFELARCSWHDHLMKESYAKYIGIISSSRVRLAFKAEDVCAISLKDISPTCGTAPLCTRELDQLREKHTPEASLASLHIIDTLTLIHEDIHARRSGESGFCDECVVHVQRGIARLQEEYWREMPKFMGVDSIVQDWS